MRILSICFLFLLILLGDGYLDRGYHRGFFAYGDKDKDGKIDESDISKNLNMAWLMEWYELTRNRESSNRTNKMTKNEFNSLLKKRGIIRVKIKFVKLQGTYVGHKLLIHYILNYLDNNK